MLGMTIASAPNAAAERSRRRIVRVVTGRSSTTICGAAPSAGGDRLPG